MIRVVSVKVHIRAYLQLIIGRLHVHTTFIDLLLSGNNENESDNESKADDLAADSLAAAIQYQVCTCSIHWIVDTLQVLFSLVYRNNISTLYFSCYIT